MRSPMSGFGVSALRMLGVAAYTLP